MSTPPSAFGTGTASVAVVLSAAIWGLYWWPIHQFEAAGLSGVWAVIALNLPAAVLMGIWVLRRPAAEWQHWRAALPIGVMTGAGLAFYGLALAETSVIRATLLFYLTPIWATLIGLYVLGEPASWSRWAAIGLGLAGLAALVAGPSNLPFNAGDVLALLSGVCWAVGGALIKRAGAIPLGGMTFAQFSALCVISLGVGLVLGGATPPEATQIRAVAPLAIAISVGVIVPAVALLFWASQRLFPGRVGLLMMSEVVVAVASASLLLPEERMTALQWLGAVLIVGAGIVEIRPFGRRDETS